VHHVHDSGACVEVADRWYGANKALQNLTSSDDETAFRLTVDFDSPQYDNGNTLLRILVGYWIQTAFVDNSSLTLPLVWQLGVACWWEPNPGDPPDPTSTSVQEALYHDALFSDMVLWRPSRWTDGTLHATQWVADSGGMQSMRGQRQIVDKTVTTLNLEIGGFSSTGAGSGSELQPAISGNLYLKYLMRQI